MLKLPVVFFKGFDAWAIIDPTLTTQRQMLINRLNEIRFIACLLVLITFSCYSIELKIERQSVGTDSGFVQPLSNCITLILNAKGR